MQLTPRLVVMLATPPLMWACNAVIGRLAIESIGPLWLNALRWIVAFALLLPLGWAALGTAEARAQIWERWKVLSILGLIGVGAYNALQYMALRTSTPLNVTLIASSSPVWTMLIGALAYGVIPTRLQLAGAVLSLSGSCARPKSTSLGTPPNVSRMLAGFTSRWMMPRLWASSSASHICTSTEMVSVVLQAPRVRRRSSTELPSTYSITM